MRRPIADGDRMGRSGHRQNADMEAGLGKLVLFDRPIQATKTGLREPREAQILIFTGVRYERDDKSRPETRSDDPVKPRRKRL